MNVRSPLFVAAVALMVMVGCKPTPTDEEVRMGEPQLDNGSFTAEINSHTIHYEIHGTGPVVMAVPNSWGLSLEGLRGFYQPLEERVTMVYFDPRGMGESGEIVVDEDMGLATVRKDFDGLRRHLGLDQVHAIGWSNGAMNLILLAAEYPDTLRSATFLHGVAKVDEVEMAQWAARQPELFQRMGRLMQRLESGEIPADTGTDLLKALWVEDFFPASCADPVAAAPILADYYRDVDFSWPHARYANLEAPLFDGREQVGMISVPCLVVAGAHDNFAPEKVRELHEGLADSTFVVFEDSGHFAPLEEPGRFQETVLEFWGVRR